MKGTRNIIIGTLFVTLVVISVFFYAATNSPSSEQGTAAIKLFNITLDCDPSSGPSDDKGGCTLRVFIYFLKEFVKYLLIFIIPLAVLMIIWGGLVILLGGGSPERLDKGKRMITTALIGVAIALSSWLIINTIFLALTGSGVN